MLLEIFYMLEVCCGLGASSRAMIMYMCRISCEGKSLLINIMTLGVLLDTYPELKPLTLILKVVKDLHKVNSKVLIMFELLKLLKHGSFKSNAQVQAML